MPTFKQVQQYMRGKYKLSQDSEDLMSMVWSYADGRTQKILLRRFQAYDRDLIEFKSAFARRDDTNPLDLLRRNTELPLGTIALVGDVYVVVYNALLDHMHLDDFELILTRLAALADTLEEEFGNGDLF